MNRVGSGVYGASALRKLLRLSYVGWFLIEFQSQGLFVFKVRFRANFPPCFR